MLAAACSTGLIFVAVALFCAQFQPAFCERWIHCDGTNTCPEDCYCVKSILKVSCTSGLNMTQFRDMGIPSDTRFLSIRGSSMSTLPANFVSQCPHLSALDLSYNALQTIHRDAFKAVPQLSNLFLSNNKLCYHSQASLPHDVFYSMTHLLRLELHDTVPSDQSTNLTYRFELYEKLQSLSTLGIDGIPGIDFDQAFSKLHNFRHLMIHKNLTVVRETTFAAFANISLSDLTLMSGELVRLDNLSLSHFKHLRTIEVSKARLSLNDISAAILRLPKQNKGLKIIRLENIFDPSGPVLYILANSFFMDLARFPITYLSLANCKISYIMPGFTKNLTNITHMILFGNRLDMYSTGILHELLALQHLAVLNISSQEVAVMRPSEQDRSIDISPSLRYNYSLYDMTQSIMSTKLQEGRIAGKKDDASPVSEGTPKKELRIATRNAVFNTDIIRLPPKLRSVEMAYTLGAPMSTIPAMTFFGNSILTRVNFAFNGVQTIKGPIRFLGFLGKHKGQILMDLTGNQAQIDPNAFDSSIGYLHLTSNNLGAKLLHDQGGFFFRNATHLKKLILMKNQIRTLSEHVFLHQTRLESLILGFNYLTDVHFDISHMERLKVLDLKSNQLTTLSSRTRKELDKLQEAKKDGKIMLVLSSNPIICSCDTLDFLRWMSETEVNVLVYGCSYASSWIKLSKENVRNSILPELQVECSSKTGIIAASVLVACLLILLCMSIGLYKLRWDIRFFMLKLIRDRKRSREVETAGRFEFDAFIVYHVGDYEWVRDELSPNMEDASSETFQLCIHHRDFMPGQPIQENIIEAITKSAKVMLVISPSFSKSAWCEHEMHLARIRSMDEGRDVIIPVLLEDPGPELSKTMASLLRKNTYIEWPSRSADRVHFWEKLREAIRSNAHDNVHFVRCKCGETVEI